MKKFFLSLAIVLSGYCSYAQNVYTLDQTSANTANNGVVLSSVTMGKDGNNHSAWIQSYSATAPDPLQLNPLGGKVGVGTTNPHSLMHINGAINQAYNSDFGAISITPSSDVNMSLSLGYDPSLGTNGSGWIQSIKSATAYTPLLLNPNNGNVGIGATNPSNKLTVFLYSGTGNVISWGNVGGGVFGALGFDVNGSYLATFSGTSGLYLNGTTGNVLIGKTTQTNTGYKLDINGSARANEVVVNTTGADFVFDKKYHLRKLSEIKVYIDKNHHLPEVPSANEMKANGLELGQMNTKLLQKVEELTLYLIEKDGELTEQKVEFSDLKNRTDNQQKQLKDQEARIAALEKALSKRNSKNTIL